MFQGVFFYNDIYVHIYMYICHLHPYELDKPLAFMFCFKAGLHMDFNVN